MSSAPGRWTGAERGAEELVVEGDWTFAGGVTVTGKARLDGDGGRVEGDLAG